MLQPGSSRSHHLVEKVRSNEQSDNPVSSCDGRQSRAPFGFGADFARVSNGSSSCLARHVLSRRSVLRRRRGNVRRQTEFPGDRLVHVHDVAGGQRDIEHAVGAGWRVAGGGHRAAADGVRAPLGN